MIKHLILLILTSLAAGALPCHPFSDSLDSLNSIIANGGTMNGPITFVPAANNNGLQINGATAITYTNSLFTSQSGSVAFAYTKTTNDQSGGLIQIGTLGSPNSIGLFYNFGNDLFYEIKNSAGTYTQISAPGTLAINQFKHIVATWNKNGNTYSLKLFIDGRYVGGNTIPGPLAVSSVLDVGRTTFYGYGQGIIDELRFFNWQLTDGEVMGEYITTMNNYAYQSSTKPVSTGQVKVIGKMISVNNRPFTVRGINYQPIQIGNTYTSANDDFNFLYQRDFPLIRNMNANTIRTYVKVTNISFLNAAYNNGIYVIMGYPINTNQDLSSPSVRAAILNDFTAYVNTYKTHPAVLGWALGNEVNLAYTGNDSHWYTLANQMAQVAYLAEGATYHPTFLVNAHMTDAGNTHLLSDDTSLPYVDIWGHNTYTGYNFNCYFDYYDTISAKPLVFTEFGIDAYNNSALTEYQHVQADWDVRQWKQLKQRSAGGLVFAYSDEWWKAGNNLGHDPGGYITDTHPDNYANEEWWGIMAVQDNGNLPDLVIPRQAYTAFEKEFNPATLKTTGTPNIGNTIQFTINDTDHPGATYLFALAANYNPGFTIAGRTVPLTYDDILVLTLLAPSTVGLLNTASTLNAQGINTVSWTIPNYPPLIGQTVYGAYIVYNPGLPFPQNVLAVSEKVNVTFLP